MKVEILTGSNFLGLPEFELNTKNSTILITGANGAGKSRMTAGLIRILQGVKPPVIVSQNESDGIATMQLSDGSRVEYEFNDKGKAKMSYFTKEGFKQTAKVAREIINRYFPKRFDIDSFLNETQPKKRLKMLSEMLGVDLSQFDTKYEKAYENRRLAGVEYDKLKKKAIPVPEKIENPQPEKTKFETEQKAKADKIKACIAEIEQERRTFEAEQKAANEALKTAWKVKNDKHLSDIQAFNKEQAYKTTEYQNACNHRTNVFEAIEKWFKFNPTAKHEKNGTEFIKDVDYYVKNNFSTGKPEKPITNLQEPEYNTDEFDNSELETLNAKLSELRNQYSEKMVEFGKLEVQYAEYNKDLQVYRNWQKELNSALELHTELDNLCAQILKDKREFISTIELPEGISIEGNDIMYNELPLHRSQQALSAIYIAAIKIALLTIGDVRTLHFEASALDKNSLQEVLDWSNANDLQLFVERPDYEAGDIEYTIIETGEINKP